jgi:hypothetical protein
LHARKIKRRSTLFGEMGVPILVENTSRPRTNWLWAELLQRSFGLDVLECSRCGSRLELIALIETPPVIRSILNHLGLPAEVPAARPARSPPFPIAQSDPRYDDEAAAP